MFLNQLFNIFKSILLSILHLGPNHLQLTLLNWDTERGKDPKSRTQHAKQLAELSILSISKRY